eukprot:4550006-Ditylum_brightwellii.AAC.1
MEWNLLAAATCRANRKGFHSDALDLAKDAERGDFIRKDSKLLQTISTVMEKGTTNVQRWTGRDITTVVCPNDIRNYQDGMGV